MTCGLIPLDEVLDCLYKLVEKVSWLSEVIIIHRRRNGSVNLDGQVDLSNERPDSSACICRAFHIQYYLKLSIKQEDQLPYGCGVACNVWSQTLTTSLWRFDSSLVRFIHWISLVHPYHDGSRNIWCYTDPFQSGQVRSLQSIELYPNLGCLKLYVCWLKTPFFGQISPVSRLLDNYRFI